jgi:hypothetical protein
MLLLVAYVCDVKDGYFLLDIVISHMYRYFYFIYVLLNFDVVSLFDVSYYWWDSL